jgi:hypothetical protein
MSKEEFDRRLAKAKRAWCDGSVDWKDALKVAFEATLSAEYIRYRAREARKKGRLFEDQIFWMWKRPRQIETSDSITASSRDRIMTYYPDVAGNRGVYVTVSYDNECDSGRGRLVSIGKATKNTFGARQLQPPRHTEFEDPEFAGQRLDTLVLRSGLDHDDALTFEKVVSSTWTIVVRSIPLLHTITKNSKRGLIMSELARVDLDQVQKSVQDLLSIDKHHDDFWKQHYDKDGPDEVDFFPRRLGDLMKQFRQIQECCLREPGRQYLRPNTKLEFDFDPDRRTLDGIRFSRSDIESETDY